MTSSYLCLRPLGDPFHPVVKLSGSSQTSVPCFVGMQSGRPENVETSIPPPSVMIHPLRFHPIFKERVWGGRRLEELFGKKLPPSVPIGESWEITDRPEGVSVIANGPLAGKDLRWLMEQHSHELLGPVRSRNGRFPLLVKILDAREKLSLQVHPPARVAAELGGEPKTEMWYVADAQAGAELYVGLRRGVTRTEFERRITQGTVADCFHRVGVRPGDVMFLPSGRVHAIGAGIVIFEIQQNSDTTYRVFDWNRAGLDGKPRPLHVALSLQCIDFDDFEPALTAGQHQNCADATCQCRALVDDPLFAADHLRVTQGEYLDTRGENPEIWGVLEGRIAVDQGNDQIEFRAGEFCLKPAIIEHMRLRFRPPVGLLRVRLR